jgi:alpha-L-rhamnosidase
VLTQNGYEDVAYDLLLQETYPSWLYPVKMGATTIWERWDGQKTDSTFQDAGMNSFNHYAYGAIGDWMYRSSAGINNGKPGYKDIIINPHITKRLDFSKAVFESPYGRIASGWERKNGKLILTVKIPSNTSATILLPANDISKVRYTGPLTGKDKKEPFTVSPDSKEGRVEIRTGSGEYVFELTE